ncbi:MAG TPA: TadE family protein [Myxococcaceae bacterium]|nr:TadE family protein [Myxococcaceae bacterium]
MRQVLAKLRRFRKSRPGQALVEAALTLPLTTFLILGTIQLFLMQQARLMADYAAMRATRAGSVNFGDCRSMTHAAIGAVLPTFARADTPANLATSFQARKDNIYGGTEGTNRNAYTGAVVWIFRERPLSSTVDPKEDFDNFQLPPDDQRLEVRLIFWYPLRIPFADWVMTRIFLAHYGLQSYLASNPLSETKRANWPQGFQISDLSTYSSATVAAEFVSRAQRGQYVYPIQSTYSMRMMTPPKPAFWQRQNCDPAP